MKTVVTGGTGLVGYNIIQTLLKQNRQVRALVRSIDKGKRILPKECEVVQGDVTDIDSIRKAMQGCEVVYHAAGFPEQWMKDLSIFERVNAGGTQNMADVALELGVKKFIFTSTIDVFKGAKGETYDESIIDTEDKGTDYERSKQQADRIVVAAMERGLPAVFVHPSGVYGPGPTESPGTNDFIVKLKKKEIPVLLPGGYPVVFSEDAGLGHVLAENAHVGSRYILSENYYSLSELATFALEALGMPPKVPAVMPFAVGKVVSVLGEQLSNLTNKAPLIPKGQLHFLQWGAIPSSAKAQQALGWKPTPIREGIQKTVAFLFPK